VNLEDIRKISTAFFQNSADIENLTRILAILRKSIKCRNKSSAQQEDKEWALEEIAVVIEGHWQVYLILSGDGDSPQH